MVAIPKPKKPTATALSKKLDKIVGQIIRSKGRCERCGSTEMLQWCHIITRGAKSIRWDLDNAFCLCHKCHYMFTNNPEKWPVFVDDHMGEGHYMSLHRRANQYLKVNHQELLDKYLQTSTK